MGIALVSITMSTPLCAPFSWCQPTMPAAASPPSSAPLPALVYDVASFHKFKPDGSSVMSSWRTDPDGLTLTHVQMKSLICTAYGIDFYQVTGGPAWVSEDMYTVIAKMDDAALEALKPLSSKQKELVRQNMAQALLADRLKLAVHHETKQLPIYALIVAKGGIKLHESKPDDDYKNGIIGLDGKPGGKGSMSMMWESGGFVLTAQGYSLDTFTAQISMQLHSKVENQTGLKGNYDFTLRYAPDWAPEPTDSSSAPTNIFTAVQEQLGLKLEATKGPVDVIVIDHIEQPSEN